MCMTQAQVSYTEMSSLLSLGPRRVPSNWWFGVSEAIFRCKRERSIVECFNITSTYFHGGGGGGGGVEGEREEAGAAQLIVTKIGGTVKVQ